MDKQNTPLVNRMGARTMRHWTLGLSLSIALLGGSFVGCAEPGPARNRVQANLVDKSIFEGEWWYTRTVVGMEDDAGFAIGEAGASAPWVGAMSNFDIASQSGVAGRIRWVIDEGFLYAYRSHEIVRGAATSPDDPGFLGQPLAVFAITDHVDIRQEYSSLTGEPTNVISEATDRRWYDRQYMRVDWSQNLVTFGLFGESLQIESLFFQFQREPVPFFVQEGGDDRFPDSWRPTFVRVGEDPTYRCAGEWPTEQSDTVHYMSFVTNELWTPMNCLGTACNTSIQISIRNAFLRIPPNHEYAVETLPNSEYDRFGIIRTENRTYIRGGSDRSDLGRYCDTDQDCGGAACDVTTHLCRGGLSSEFALTDFLTFYRLRHNFYSDSLTDRQCIADWQCDNRFGTNPEIPPEQADGSNCDVAAQRCTIPLRRREVRSVAYHLNPGFPRHLVRAAFETVAAWNEAFMRGQRELRGEDPPSNTQRQACQSADPTQYCYCNTDRSFRAAEVDAAGTCSYHTDLFLPVAEREARGEVAPYDCTVVWDGQDPAAPTSFDDYPAEHAYSYRFEGEECMLVLKVNSCDRDPEAACESLGDLRYQFFNYVSAAGAGWCGVMQPVQDPTNGEAISIPINMGGLCLDRIANNAVDLWPVLRGEASEDALFNGENIRGYFDRLGDVHRPIGFAPSIDGAELDLSAPRPAIDLQQLNAMFDRVAPRFERMRATDESRALRFSDRIGQIAGTDIEQRLVGSLQLEGLTAVANSNPLEAVAMEDQAAAGRLNPTSQEFIDRVSPFRHDLRSDMADVLRRDALERVYVEYPREALFTARYQQYWANAFQGRTVEEAHVRWTQAWLRAVMMHELGHGLGLEHNFAATYDRDHYGDGYFALVTQTDPMTGDHLYALPRSSDFDTDRNGDLTDQEAIAWANELRRVRTERLNRGLGNYTAASLMDYDGALGDILGLGHYDRAAVFFNYFNQAEAFVGDPTYTDGTATSLEGLQRSDITPRTLWTWYRGGESCGVDTDCPYRQGSTALASDQGIFQRCVRNPRYSQIPTACAGDQNCICSNFDEDFIDYMEGAGPFQSDRDRDGIADHAAIKYLFCSNSRLNDISWCSVYDAGESFQETIDHYRQIWQENYPRNYFRNFRRGFSSGSRATSSIVDAAKMYQHLFFRYFNEPEFRREAGPLGFLDQYFASIDAMNWLAELAQLPDVGSYRLDPTTNSYVHMGEALDMPGSDMSLAPGQGFYHWSRYQDGLYGFFRMERAGTFWDKLFALRALTVRDWGLSFTIDERYFINFYDLFPVEMTELFGGYMTDNDRWMAPRVRMVGGEPQVYYLNYFRGAVTDPATGELVPARPSNEEVYSADPPIQDTSNEILRLYAAIYALAEFPVFYDTSFERRLAIFKLENGDGFEIPNVQQDGTQTCGFRRVVPGSGHRVCADNEDADYIIYTSDRLHTPYVATKIRNRLAYNLEEEQLGFQLLYQLDLKQERLRVLEALGTRTPAQEEELRRLRRELQAGDSFLEALIEVQRIFGITSWLL